MTDETPDETPGEVTPAPAVLRVVDSNATPEEVAAIVAVLASLGGGEPAARPVRSSWSHPARLHRRTAPAGRGGWRASALPR